MASSPAPAYPTPRAAYPAAGGGAGESTGSPGGFLAWLNATRARHGLGPVGWDAGLASDAAANNGHQQARGMNHHFMGSARRQNVGMGNLASVSSAWMASPAHLAALMDPTIRVVAVAGSGPYWTFNGR